ncbi:MAG TPA: Zn-dependent alcohol dehydrogenase [Acidimicrobiales bacterium]|nr:Zn-dependent alcohol dehydrogenase [Acidimicrobiales bacterium]
MGRAAVLAAVGQPLEMRDDVEVEAPHPGEVRVRMVAAGVCHSDLSMCDGTLMAPMPIVLGHEGAGVVDCVGEGVTRVQPGDRVVISWVPQCGDCFFCLRRQGHLCERANAAIASGGLLDGTTRLRSRGAQLHQMSAAGTFADLTVVPECGVVQVDDDLDLGLASLLGCGVLTGIGAATRTADIKPGDTVAVLGCGGVGLNVVQGARIAGADGIIAVDTNRAKLELAERFGATATVDASAGDPVSVLMQLTGQRGADVVFEVIGLPRTIDQAVTMTRRGGQTVLVGIPRMDTMLNLPAFLGVVLAAKTITGCWYGSSNVLEDIPALMDLHRKGELELAALVTGTVALEDVNPALDALRSGEVTRTLIRFPD